MAEPLARRTWQIAVRVFATGGLALTPYAIELPHGGLPHLVFADAHAKGGSGGKGNSGNSGNGNGNSGNNGQGNGPPGGNTAGGTGQTTTNPANADDVGIQAATIQVVHPDGISETVKGGRFRMKDAQGRTIIDRPAKASDIKRLKAL